MRVKPFAFSGRVARQPSHQARRVVGVKSARSTYSRLYPRIVHSNPASPLGSFVCTHPIVSYARVCALSPPHLV